MGRGEAGRTSEGGGDARESAAVVRAEDTSRNPRNVLILNAPSAGTEEREWRGSHDHSSFTFGEDWRKKRIEDCGQIRVVMRLVIASYSKIHFLQQI